MTNYLRFGSFNAPNQTFQVFQHSGAQSFYSLNFVLTFSDFTCMHGSHRNGAAVFVLDLSTFSHTKSGIPDLQLAQDNWVAQQNLQKTPTGDFLSLNKLAGPTICCFWVRILPVSTVFLVMRFTRAAVVNY